MVEAENSFLVLENKQHRQWYGKCHDSIAHQVVQAKLPQKGKCSVISEGPNQTYFSIHSLLDVECKCKVNTVYTRNLTVESKTFQ